MHDRSTACGFPDQGYSVFVTAEEMDVFLYPFQGRMLILQRN